jgi:hypothetical protein
MLNKHFDENQCFAHCIHTDNGFSDNEDKIKNEDTIFIVRNIYQVSMMDDRTAKENLRVIFP